MQFSEFYDILLRWEREEDVGLQFLISWTTVHGEEKEVCFTTQRYKMKCFPGPICWEQTGWLAGQTSNGGTLINQRDFNETIKQSSSYAYNHN